MKSYILHKKLFKRMKIKNISIYDILVYHTGH